MRDCLRLIAFFLSVLTALTSCDSVRDVFTDSKSAKMIRPELYYSIDTSFSREWSDGEREAFVKRNSKSDLDRFMFSELVLDFEHYYTYPELEEYLNTFEYRENKSSKAIIVVDYISSKTPAEMDLLLGKSSKMRLIDLFDGEGMREVYFYYDDMIEISYKDGLSNYIKINMPPKHVIVIKDYNYSEIKKNERHSTFKVSMQM